MVETGFHHVGQAGLELTSGDPPSSASQSAGITGVNHCTWLHSFLFKAEQYSVCICHNSFIYSSSDKVLGCFHLVAIVNSGAMNVHVHVFV